MSIKKHIDLETLANVVETIPSNIFFKDTDLKYVFSSHIWEQIDSGSDEDFDIYGKSDRDIRKDTENLDNVEKSDRRIIETGVGSNYTIKSMVDGHVQYLDITKEPVKDKDGNVIGIVGLINDVTRVTEELSEMLENEKEYHEALKAGALLAYSVNLTHDILEDDLIEEIDGNKVNLLDLIGMKSPCSYSEMIDKYSAVVLNGESQEEYREFHNPKRLLDLFNEGHREITQEMKLSVNSVDGNVIEVWSYETVLLMHDSHGDIKAFISVNDTTEERQKEEQIRHQLEENVKEAERIANMKSDFLANMSHEIRTPMNAVIGMAEMALREDLPDAARDYINQIKSSGNALLGIINDILDFSKIDSGKMDIIPDNYDPLSVIHDISGVIMNRIGEKELELVGTVNPDLPIGLFGDAMRLRQIIINLANNAVKFTESGYVKVDVDFEKTGEDEIMLSVSVTDTGMGIKEEDLNKLFVSFQQLDSKRNRNIEGTGLGLAICAKLVDLMGGTIGVSSEHGKGSEFKFSIPQKVTDWTPSIEIEDKDDKLVVGYWEGSAVRDLFYGILDDLSVENYSFNDIAKAKQEHAESFEKKKIHFITSYRLYTEKLVQYADSHPEIQFIVVCDITISADNSKPNVLFIKKPLSTVGISMALNNELFHAMEAESIEFDFVAPDAKVLIVDDNEVNLVVAEGLLEPLKMQVKTALSGKKALELLENEKFDLIFMDHMMPELDGVETTRIIRRLHPDLSEMPVIALSANAVGNAREMFLSEGMNDFVAKPIELRTITNKIRQWLPKDKIKRSLGADQAESTPAEPEEKLVIGDLDIDAAVSLIGGQKLYLTILEKYFSAIKSKAEIIKACEESGDIKTYTIEVHALKSSSKQIGAMELSEMAKELEACGNAGDVDTIHAKTPALLERYLGYIDVLSPLFATEEEATEKEGISNEKLSEYFEKMLVAAEELDMDAMEEISDEMDKYAYEGEANTLMQELKEAAANIDVDSIEEIINKWKAL